METNWEHGKLNKKFYTDQREAAAVAELMYTRAYLGPCLVKEQ